MTTGRRPYGPRERAAFAVGGAVVGGVVGVLVVIQAGGVCVDRVAGSFCGLNFLWWNVRTPVGLALAGLSGAALGAVLGLAVGRLVGTPRST
ncbi:MAG TPA: hypothetical protein VFA25_05385 [Actinomycetota bacterium]|nr:hypothetical protein [Actinomycetota bacterium]